MKTLLGLQQLQLGSILKNETNARKALVAMKEAGFDVIELDGFMIRKTPLMAKLLLSLSGMGIKASQKLPWGDLIREAGLSVISIHEDIDTLEKNFQAVIDEINVYKPKYIVLTGMYRFPYCEEQALGSLVVRLNRIGRALRQEGISFLCHNHNVEFQTVDGEEKALDILLQGLNPEWVNFEFDSYWAIDAGADIETWMKKIGKRMRLYHICDRGNLHKGTFLTPIVKTDAVELGKGNFNLDKYIRLAKENEVDAIILEQHRNYINKDPLQSLGESAEFLKKHC